MPNVGSTLKRKKLVGKTLCELTFHHFFQGDSLYQLEVSQPLDFPAAFTQHFIDAIWCF